MDRASRHHGAMSTWTGAAEAYCRSFATLCAGTIDTLLDATVPADSLLDVGCGTGELARAAAQRGLAVTAVDADADMVEATRVALGRRDDPPSRSEPLAPAPSPSAQLSTESARKTGTAPRSDERPGRPDTGSTAAVLHAAAPTLPIADRSASAVTANFLVNHVPDPRATTADLARVLAPGGRLAMTIWPAEPGPHLRAVQAAAHEVGAVAPPSTRLSLERDFPRSPEGLARLAEQAGLQVLRAEEVTWTWRTTAEDILAGIRAGIAGPGRLYLAQPPDRRAELDRATRAHWQAHAEGGGLAFPVTVVLVLATICPQDGV